MWRINFVVVFSECYYFHNFCFILFEKCNQVSQSMYGPRVHAERGNGSDRCSRCALPPAVLYSNTRGRHALVK